MAHTETSAAFYRSLLERIGIEAPESQRPDLLGFWIGSAWFVLDLSRPAFLRLVCRLVSGSDLALSPPGFFSGTVDAAMVQAGARFNLSSPPMKVFFGEDDVVFEQAMFLFGAVEPDRLGERDLPVLDEDKVEPLLRRAIVQLDFGIKEFYAAAGRRCCVTGQAPLMIPIPIVGHPDPEGYWPAVFAARGLRTFPLKNPDGFSVMLILDGFACVFVASRRDPWYYRLALRFQERARFDVNSAPVNTFDGVADGDLELLCNALNAHHPVVKAQLSEGDGILMFTVAGSVPQWGPEDVADLFDTLYGLLHGAATTLFEMGAYNFTPYAEELRRSADQPVQRLEWRARSSAHRWETVVGRRLATELSALKGIVLTGYRLSMEREEVDIDNLLICTAGVFVIECKSHRGLISGARNANWTMEVAGRTLPVRATRGGNPCDQALQVAYALKNRLSALGGEAASVFVHAAVLFPDRTRFQLRDVAVGEFRGNAPAVFTVEDFIGAVNASPPSTLSPASVRAAIASLDRLFLNGSS